LLAITHPILKSHVCYKFKFFLNTTVKIIVISARIKSRGKGLDWETSVEERSHDYRKQPFAARTRREDRGHACVAGVLCPLRLLQPPTARPPPPSFNHSLPQLAATHPFTWMNIDRHTTWNSRLRQSTRQVTKLPSFSSSRIWLDRTSKLR